MSYKAVCMDSSYYINVDDSDADTYLVDTVFSGLNKPKRIDKSFADQKCPICLAYYSPGRFSRQMPCGHIFHKACIDTIVKERGLKSACPICKIDPKIKIIRDNI